MGIKSMTGYGSASLETETLSLFVEVKSLNSKFLELNLKIPRDYSDKEVELRNWVTQTLERGKVSLSIERTQKGHTRPRSQVNLPIFQAYYENLKAAAQTVGAEPTDLFKLALSMPEAMLSDEADTEALAQEWDLVAQAVQTALADCNRFREDEGRVLGEKLLSYTQLIAERLETIAAADPERISNTRQRLWDKLAEHVPSEKVDKNRFEQELIYYIEKLDINEEKVRLRSHIDYFQEALRNGNGKKLGFIAQEMGREINTIGSKVNEAQIQRLVVEMKEELEKIKEQSLNVL